MIWSAPSIILVCYTNNLGTGETDHPTPATMPKSETDQPDARDNADKISVAKIEQPARV